MGFCGLKTLEAFEPLGVRFGCVYTRQFAGRVSNMIFANPSAAGNLEYIRRLFRIRHQRSLGNVFLLIAGSAGSTTYSNMSGAPVTSSARGCASCAWRRVSGRWTWITGGS